MLQSICKRRWRVPLAAICQFLLLQPVFAAQVPAQQTRQGISIVVVEGERSRNVVQQIPPRPLVVRVEDASNRPVTGATVVFSAPESGPSGDFANDSRTFRASTGTDGLASAGVFHPNSISGSYQIRVTAEYQGQTAAALISQTNVAERKGHGKLIAIGAIVGAAAGAAIAFRNKDNGSPSSNTPTITFGGSAVGAPR